MSDVALEHDVLFIGDLATRLRISRRTIDKRLRAGTFPIPELPRLDDRHRWSLAVVNAWIARADHPEPAQVILARRRRALTVIRKGHGR